MEWQGGTRDAHALSESLEVAGVLRSYAGDEGGRGRPAGPRRLRERSRRSREEKAILHEVRPGTRIVSNRIELCDYS